MTGYLTEDQTIGPEEEFSDYGGSDLERMAANNSDED